MVHRSFSVVIVVVLTFGACQSPPRGGGDPIDTTATPPDNTEAAPPDEVPNSDRTGPDPGVSLQTILDQAFERDPQTQELPVLDRLNEPQRTEAEPRENRHIPNQTDTLRTLYFDGLTVRVYDVTDGKEILERVTVTSEGYETDDGLGVGVPRSEVESLRGAPDRQQNGAHVYEIGEGLPTMLHVFFDDDVVSRMEWRFPVD